MSYCANTYKSLNGIIDGLSVWIEMEINTEQCVHKEGGVKSYRDRIFFRRKSIDGIGGLPHWYKNYF